MIVIDTISHKGCSLVFLLKRVAMFTPIKNPSSHNPSFPERTGDRLLEDFLFPSRVDLNSELLGSVRCFHS